MKHIVGLYGMCFKTMIDLLPPSSPSVPSGPPSLLIEPQFGELAPADPRPLVDSHHTGGSVCLCVIETP